MKKQIGKNLMQKWKNKIRVRLSALDKKKLVLTNIPYILTAFYTNRASFLYVVSQNKVPVSCTKTANYYINSIMISLCACL